MCCLVAHLRTQVNDDEISGAAASERGGELLDLSPETSSWAWIEERARAPQQYPAAERQSGTEGLHGCWTLPGGGEAHGDCGSKRYRGCLHVDDHPAGLRGRKAGLAYVEVYKKSCHRAACPQCWPDWREREIRRALHRFGSCKSRKRVIHVVVSPPSRCWQLSIEKLRSLAYVSARSAGFKGGCAVLHLYRHERFSPHFHVLGHGWIVRTPEVYRRTGWIVKNKGLRRDLAQTLRYELGHAAVHERLHTLTWFGSMAYSKFRAPPYEEAGAVCPLCSSPLVSLLWTGELGAPEPPLEAGAYYLSPEGWYELGGWRG